MAASTSDLEALGRALDRLDGVLAEENLRLQSRDPYDINQLAQRKSRCLLELARLQERLDGSPGGEIGLAIGGRIKAVRARLEQNRSLLSTYLAASEEVASVLARAMLAAESDGTYEAAPPARGGDRSVAVARPRTAEGAPAPLGGDPCEGPSQGRAP